MKTIIYNKLIRDKIPEIIEEAGKKALVEREDGQALLDLLNDKLTEELNEYKETENIEELADLVEVVYGILDYKGITIEEFEKMRLEKNKHRGSFKEGFVLLKVVEE